MKDLHPSARALIVAAKRRESALSAGARDRVHKSVLRRTIAFGSALATTGTATVAAKGGVLAVVLASPIVSSSVIGALGAGAIFVARSAWMAPASPHVAAPVASHAIVQVSRPGEPAPGERPRELSAALSSSPAYAEQPQLAMQPLPTAVAPAPDPARTLRRDPGSVVEGPDRHAPGGEGTAHVVYGESPPVAAASSSSAPAHAPANETSAGLTTALDVLHRAHAALREGEPNRALELLRGSAEVLDDGPFAEEALAARASALCQLGRQREAGATIDQFLAVWPSSPLAARLREGCAALGGIQVDKSK